MNFAPSKKVLFLGIICLIVLGTIFYLSKKEGASTYSLESGQENADLFEKDSDRDGIPDWEETLWGTDPLNPSTKGDGTDDKQFIEELKNQDSGLLPVLDSSISIGATNRTDYLSQQLLKEYLNIKQTTGADQKSFEDLANRTLNKIYSTPGAKNIYESKDIKTTGSRADPNSVMAYTNSIIGALIPYQKSPISFNTIDLNDISDPRFSQLSKEMSEYFLDIAKSIVVLPAPTDLLNFHLNLSNNFAKISGEFETLSKADDDTVSALSSVKKIKELQLTQNYLFAFLEYYLSTNGIILSESSGFYIKPQ